MAFGMAVHNYLEFVADRKCSLMDIVRQNSKMNLEFEFLEVYPSVNGKEMRWEIGIFKVASAR
jgi:hypothetical protein